MKMISTPAAVAANQYTAYVHNCQRNPACEPSFSAPLPGVPYLQLYVDFGNTKPVMVEFQAVDHCNGGTEQIFPSNYVVGLNPDGTWYGVFKYFNTPVNQLTTFVVWLSATVQVGPGYAEKTFFSEMLMVEPCAPLTKIKSCQPEGATTTGFDVNGLYYGTPVNLDFLGLSGVRYFHIAYVRYGKVREVSNKGTFKSSLTRNFRTVIEKIHQVETELVPKWYKNELLAIYARGAIQVDNGPTYLVSDLAVEPINDDDLMWKPFAQLRETFRLYFGCDSSECVECCSPMVTAVTVYSDAESNPSASGGESESESVGPVLGDCLYWSVNANAGGRLRIQKSGGAVILDKSMTGVADSGNFCGLSGTHVVTVNWQSGSGNIIKYRICDKDGNEVWYFSMGIGGSNSFNLPFPSAAAPYYVYVTAGNIEPTPCPLG